MKMRKRDLGCIMLFFVLCCSSVLAKEKYTILQQDCNVLLAQLIKSSDLDYPNKEYYVRIEDTRDDTVIIKAYVRNNLSDNPKKPQMVESVISWLIIPPERDGIYQSFNALDPEEPDFKKLKIDKKNFDTLVKCIDVN